MIYAVLDHPDLDGTDLSALQTIMYGASPMSPTRLVEGIERIGPVFAQLYGQTECAGIATSMSRADHRPDDLHRLTACGFPMPGVRVAIRDDDGDRGRPTASRARSACRAPASCRATSSSPSSRRRRWATAGCARATWR